MTTTGTASFATRARPVYVLGMHHSGGSVVAKVLNVLGFSSGETCSMDSMTAQLNDRILMSVGGSWQSPPSPSSLHKWRRRKQVESWREVILASIQGACDDDSTSLVISDPRLSWTLPIWEFAVPALHTVMPIRNPISVAQSLQQHHGIPKEVGAQLWIQYNKEALSVAAEPILVSYERLFRDPVLETHRLCEALRKSPPKLEGFEQIVGFLDSSPILDQPVDGSSVGPQLGQAIETFELLTSRLRNVTASRSLSHANVGTHGDEMRMAKTALAERRVAELRNSLANVRARLRYRAPEANPSHRTARAAGYTRGRS